MVRFKPKTYVIRVVAIGSGCFVNSYKVVMLFRFIEPKYSHFNADVLGALIQGTQIALSNIISKQVGLSNLIINKLRDCSWGLSRYVKGILGPNPLRPAKSGTGKQFDMG